MIRKIIVEIVLWGLKVGQSYNFWSTNLNCLKLVKKDIC